MPPVYLTASWFLRPLESGSDHGPHRPLPPPVLTHSSDSSLSLAVCYFLPRGTSVVLWMTLRQCHHVTIPATCRHNVEPGFLVMPGHVTVTPCALRPLRSPLPLTPTLAHTFLPHTHVVKRKGSRAPCSPHCIFQSRLFVFRQPLPIRNWAAEGGFSFGKCINTSSCVHTVNSSATLHSLHKSCLLIPTAHSVCLCILSRMLLCFFHLVRWMLTKGHLLVLRPLV